MSNNKNLIDTWVDAMVAYNEHQREYHKKMKGNDQPKSIEYKTSNNIFYSWYILSSLIKDLVTYGLWK